MLRLLPIFAILTALFTAACSRKVLPQPLPVADAEIVADTVAPADTDAALPDTAFVADTMPLTLSWPVDFLLVDKSAMTLSAYVGDRAVAVFPCATGANTGDKVKSGDCRTPEGSFFISEIVDASSWTHDFGDGLGEIKGCYGPWFLRLHTPPHTGIGIHGTHLPSSLGTRASEGCIRLLNENVDSLRRMVVVGTPVIILPAPADIKANLDEAQRQAAEEARADSPVSNKNVPGNFK